MRYCGIAALAMATGVWCASEAFAASADRPLVDNRAVGQSFRDCKALCPEMVVIPAGKFTIGTPTTEIGRGTDENPQQVVTITYALAVGKYPVTRGEFAAFVEDTGRARSAHASIGMGNRSVSKKAFTGTIRSSRTTGIPSFA
jgi:formylglycine-generating enzyme required for sulfatase activity